MPLFDPDDEIHPDQLLKPVSLRAFAPAGAAFLLVGLLAAALGVLSLLRADYARGWGITMLVLGAPVAGIGLQLLLHRRWPVRPTAPWALFAFALLLTAAGIAMVLTDQAWEPAETCWVAALGVAYVGWRRRRRDAA